MPTTIVTPDQDTLVTEIQIAAPPERVFQALSDPKQQSIWWNNSACPLKSFDMDARRGGKWGFATVQTNMTINNVSQFECHGEILEYDPPRVLAYTWISNWHQDKKRRTIVRWELMPKDDGTLVKVSHSGLAEEDV